ncbi:MAG: hypothetical protein ACI8W8_001814, partial [Rhodothermales bacterium]
KDRIRLQALQTNSMTADSKPGSGAAGACLIKALNEPLEVMAGGGLNARRILIFPRRGSLAKDAIT